MGLFDRDKMSKAAGEWAAYAMGCMVFADGGANDPEIAAARGQVTTNPVLKNSLGSERAEKLFNETIEAVAQIPEAMLPSYEVKLGELAGKIDEADEKNFALATVIAVAMGDRSLSDAEYAMLVRFRDMLGATIPLPGVGQATPAPYRQAAQVQPPADGAAGEGGQAAAQPQAASAGASATTEAAAASADADADTRTCPTCHQPVPLYPGYGYWCNQCQTYVSAEAPAETEAAPAQAEAAQAGAQPSAGGPVSCPSCGQPTQYYEGYGHWCAACQRYAAQV